MHYSCHGITAIGRWTYQLVCSGRGLPVKRAEAPACAATFQRPARARLWFGCMHVGRTQTARSCAMNGTWRRAAEACLWAVPASALQAVTRAAPIHQASPHINHVRTSVCHTETHCALAAMYMQAQAHLRSRKLYSGMRRLRPIPDSAAITSPVWRGGAGGLERGRGQAAACGAAPRGGAAWCVSTRGCSAGRVRASWGGCHTGKP